MGGIVKFKINYLEENKNNDLMQTKNYINIYLFGIKIKEIKLERKIHAPKTNNKEINTIYMLAKQIKNSLTYNQILDIITGLLKTVKVNKLDMDLGINLNDPIYNAYIIALVNALIPLFIVNNNKNINLDNIKYNTFISQKTIFLNIKCELSLSTIRNIFRIFKVIIVLIKQKIKDVKNKSKDKAKINRQMKKA